MNRILELLGLDHKPKTFGGKVLKGFQIITIPLFLFVLAVRPFADERNQRLKENKQKQEEMKLAKRGQEIMENRIKENPELQKVFDDLRAASSQQNNNNNNNNKK
ncbi:hypothetical protein PPL_05092 [Heterostelium album PN500]|uniref:Uncharacterized protein n=1 Tax=Heterostelium pallidum (strain ATCC 26659 / Pp 5 / PN500) TaxID=670386 RepID=D3B9E8_HETP5|nr:hypothetical protein PPL_05092 [Heterostelium album PN500]EFA81860.1 hypothetical protein PPL_05092 [Heterostelium album PN500]|eukprot:XP_020433977.1 hypothetical protein PPL_05092 [Heterostelium album PN500]